MDIKRIFDISVSGAGIAVLAMPVLGVAFTMAAVNRSGPFFVQERIGKDGNPFRIIKIKTMNDARDESGRLLPDDQRVSTLGIWLRKSRIDELPQLINVFKGDMSIVGPRPVTAHVPVIAADEKRRRALPGLTGPAQIAGKNGLMAEEILELDHGYIDHHSFGGDLKIMLLTPLSLIKNIKTPHYNKDAQDSLRAHEIM
jgi:lipopolysaccharide/colanic/teichoic acid biosynthesis glycosyltransferase